MAETQRRLLAWVEREVRACRPIGLRYFRSASLRVERKPDRSPVTAADRAIEDRLRRAIGRAFPGEAIVGEEFGDSGRRGDSYWTIDPVDGTRAFARGLPTWSIMVGRVERGRATLGVCDFPALGMTMRVAPGVAASERVGGAVRPFPQPRRIAALEEAVLFHGGAHWWIPTPYANGFLRLISRCDLERAFGDCYGYLWAFRGCADAVIDQGVKIWDMVPLAALAQATGRRLTDCSGRDCFTGPETLMASPAVIRRLVNILRTR